MRATVVPLLAASIVGCADGGTPERVTSASLASDVSVCTDIQRAGTLTLAPAPADLQYRRCGTAGGEAHWTVSLSADHQRLAALTNVGTVRLVATDTWKELAELASPRGAIDALAFSPDGAVLATLSEEAGQVVLWSARDASVLQSIQVGTVSLGGLSFSASLRFSPDGKQLATSRQTTIDLTTGAVREWSTQKTGDEQVDRVRGIRPSSMRFLAGGRHMLAYGWQQLTNMISGDSFWLTDLDSGERTLLFSYRLQSIDLEHIVSHDGRLFAYPGAGGGLRLHQVGLPDPIAIDALGGLTVLAFSPDDRELYTLTQNEIEVLEVPTLKSLRRFPWTFKARFIALSGDGLLVASTENGTEWWNPDTGERVRVLPDAFSTITWSADGALAAGATSDSLLRVWSAADGTDRCRLPRLTVSLPTLRPPPAIQPPTPLGSFYGPWITSQTDDGALRLMKYYSSHFGSVDWYRRAVEETASGKVLREFRQTTSVQGEISSDGSRVITDEGGYMAIWCR